MKNRIKSLLLLMAAMVIIFSSCSKQNTMTSPDPSVNSNAMLKNYQAASSNDALLVNFHQHAGTGNHDSCFYYWHQFNQCDSLFSFQFYEYCRTIYANNGGHNYGHGGWNWHHENGGMHEDNWQCGLDTLQFQNWNGFGDCRAHDSLMYHQMEKNHMTGFFSTQANQVYSNMQSLRADHYSHHRYHSFN